MASKLLAAPSKRKQTGRSVCLTKGLHLSFQSETRGANMDSRAVRIEVFGEDSADANRRTSELADWLGRRTDGIELRREKTDKATQDLGTVLIALLSAPAAVALAKEPATELAKGVADWLRKRRGSVTIGDIKVENADPETIERIIRIAMKD
ncbi:hypothetical protein [Paraburkholderia graminis]|uniref:hypothetical protein n=1 Tax=Paraburkholderia graminis TaxID=60548 RepID=UPI002792C049|nr:hypothetical protein [Paraburkholderia graminis]MDQ0627122.1 hypothetical protein [Paraburkholderia graminis]